MISKERTDNKLPEGQTQPKSEALGPGKKPLPPKTDGERFYDGFQFVFGKVFIIALTAGLAFIADQKHGPNKIAGVPNYLKQFQGWFHNKVFHNKVYPVAQKGDTSKLIGGALVSTMILSHAGNFFAPCIKWLENNREGISNWYNKRFGTEQDVQDAHERLKDIPKQNWGDVVKGRAIAWGSVFTVMLAAYVTAGKSKKTGRYWLDIYEDKFARIMTGFTKGGKEIAATPIAKELTEAQKANKTYRFSKVLALDLYATTGSLMIWNMFSRMFAKKRAEQEGEQQPALVSTIDTHHYLDRATPEEYHANQETVAHGSPVMPQVAVPKGYKGGEVHCKKIQPKPAIQSAVAKSYADMVEKSELVDTTQLGA